MCEVFRCSLLRQSQVRLRLRLAPKGRDLVGIQTDHQIVDVIVDFREPVAGARRNYYDVSSLDLMRHAVSNIRSVVSRSIKFPDGLKCRRPALTVDDIRTENERRRTGNDMVNLADEIMFSNGVRVRTIQLAAIYNSDSDMRFSNVDVPYLLIGQRLRDSFLRIGFDFCGGNQCPRAHVASRLRIGGID